MNSNGNVLFLILIAVALFAALSYAVTSSSRGTGSNADSEKTSLNISVLSNYVSGLRSAYVRMKVSNSCSNAQISFEKSPYTDTDIYTSYPNANAPADKHCHFFHSKGGGLSPGSPQALGVSEVGYVSGTLPGLPTGYFLFIADGLTYEGCKQVNKAVGYNAPSYDPLVPPYYAQINNYVGSGTVDGSLSFTLSGQTSGCFASVGSGTAGINYIGSGTNVFWFFATIGQM